METFKDSDGKIHYIGEGFFSRQDNWNGDSCLFYSWPPSEKDFVWILRGFDFKSDEIDIDIEKHETEDLYRACLYGPDGEDRVEDYNAKERYWTDYLDPVTIAHIVRAFALGIRFSQRETRFNLKKELKEDLGISFDKIAGLAKILKEKDEDSYDQY